MTTDKNEKDDEIVKPVLDVNKKNRFEILEEDMINQKIELHGEMSDFMAKVK